MVECTRCGREVDTLQMVTPDVVTREVTDSIDDSEGDLAGDGEMEVCVECMDELKGD